MNPIAKSVLVVLITVGISALGYVASSVLDPSAAGPAASSGPSSTLAESDVGTPTRVPVGIGQAPRSPSDPTSPAPAIGVATTALDRPIPTAAPGSVPAAALTPPLVPAQIVAASVTPGDDAQYRAWLAQTVSGVDDATQQLIALELPSTHDASWETKVAQSIAVWTRAYTDAKVRQPPSDFAIGHVSVVQALGAYQAAGESLARAAVKGDDDVYVQSINMALQASQGLSAALDQLDSKALPTPVASATPLEAIPVTTTPSRPPIVSSVRLAGTPAPTSVASPVSPAQVAHVGNTGGSGTYLRHSALQSDHWLLLPDGTPLVLLGSQATRDNDNWHWVRDPRGNVGWVQSQYIVSVATPGP